MENEKFIAGRAGLKLECFESDILDDLDQKEADANERSFTEFEFGVIQGVRQLAKAAFKNAEREERSPYVQVRLCFTMSPSPEDINEPTEFTLTAFERKVLEDIRYSVKELGGCKLRPDVSGGGNGAGPTA